MSDEIKLTDEIVEGAAGGGANGDAWWQNGQDLYRVVYGDTLSEIAMRFGVSMGQIMYLNRDKITNPDFIQQGWILRIV